MAVAPSTLVITGRFNCLDDLKSIMYGHRAGLKVEKTTRQFCRSVADISNTRYSDVHRRGPADRRHPATHATRLLPAGAVINAYNY